MSETASGGGSGQAAAAAVVGIYADRDAAGRAAAALTAAGFPAERIGVVAATSPLAEGAAPAGARPAGHLRSAARGVLFGAVLGVLLSVEAVLLGQGGPVGEIEIADEALLYGIPSGALAGPGASPSRGDSALYRDELRRGRVLVVATVADEAESERAEAALLAGTESLDVRVERLDRLDLPAAV